MVNYNIQNNQLSSKTNTATIASILICKSSEVIINTINNWEKRRSQLHLAMGDIEYYEISDGWRWGLTRFSREPCNRKRRSTGQIQKRHSYSNCPGEWGLYLYAVAEWALKPHWTIPESELGLHTHSRDCLTAKGHSFEVTSTMAVELLMLPGLLKPSSLLVHMKYLEHAYICFQCRFHNLGI